MKILMTADTVGGVWTYALELARGLAAFDCEVILATMGAPRSPSQLADSAAIPTLTVEESEFRLEWMEDPWTDVAAAGSWLLELARELSPDVIHLNGYVHGACAWQAPVLVVGHSCVCSWYEAVRGQPAGREWDRYRHLVREGLQAADLVVSPTQAMLRSLQRHYGPLRTTKVIANGRSPTPRTRISKEPFIFTAGRLWDEAKNVAALEKIASRLKWPVRVAGLQHPEKTLEAACSLQSLGCLSAAEMSDTFARAAIYALPARYEPFGLTPVEAALAGCPLVLGDIDSLREVWGDAAEFVHPDDLEGLARVLNRLSDDEALRHTRAQQAFERARQLTTERMTAAYVESYRELVSAYASHQARVAEEVV